MPVAAVSARYPPSIPAKFMIVVRIGSAMTQRDHARDDEIPEGVDGRSLRARRSAR